MIRVGDLVEVTFSDMHTEIGQVICFLIFFGNIYAKHRFLMIM